MTEYVVSLDAVGREVPNLELPFDVLAAGIDVADLSDVLAGNI